MLSLLGHIAILLALLLALTGTVASAAEPWLPGSAAWGRRAAYLMASLVAFAVMVMEVALLRHDYSVKYVSEVGGPGIPLYYTVVSLWGALEGSILLWAVVLSAFTVAFLRSRRGDGSPSDAVATAILLAISSFFLLVVAGPGDPFAQVNPAVACQTGCQGPNPLLQNHWMMGVHPLLLYIGYVGLSVPFAVAMGALLRGVPDAATMRSVRRWALVPWIFLSLGIVAGMWWSYAVLGWGGYWSWDPVENVAVMPWLVTTAFLHSIQVQERRQMLKTWTMSLVIAAFLFSLLGTFLTRSGVLASVHSFTASGIGALFLVFFAVCLVLSLALLLQRSSLLAAPGVLESSVCRETAFLLNNLLLVAITFTILLGTLFPLLVEAVQGTQLSVGAPYFDRVAVPIGVALLFLMGVGPALPWGAARLEEVQYRLLLPVALGAATVLLLLALGVHGVGPLVTFGGAVFVGAVTVTRVAADIRARRGNTTEGRITAGGRLLRANPRRYGGYIAHLGVLLIIVGIAGSQTYQVRKDITLRVGQRAVVDGYTVVYRGWHPHPESNRMSIQATVDSWRGNESLGRMLPAENVYPSLPQPVLTPAVREEPFDLFSGGHTLTDLGQVLHGRNPFEDLYIVFSPATSKPDGPGIFQLLVNPLVGLIWLGGGVLGLGGLLALLPARRRRPAEARRRAPVVPARAVEEVTA